MQSTSSTNTLAASAGVIGIAPVVEWVANSLFHAAMPPQVVLFVAAALVTIGHFAVNAFNAFISVDDPRFAAALKSESATLPTTVSTS
jgi:hypothetical protein